MRKSVTLVLVALAVAAVSPAYALGGKDPADRSAKQPEVKVDLRVLSAYVIADTDNRRYIEGMYLPQAAAAYYPTPFSGSAKERKFEFDRNLPFRVLSTTNLSAGVRLYSLETAPNAGAPWSSSPQEGRSYTFSFPRSALGKSGSAAIQPGFYALDRAVRLSGASAGVVRLEALSYDEASTVFKASVHVAPQSTNR